MQTKPKCRICRQPATRRRGLVSLCASIDCEAELGLKLLDVHKKEVAKKDRSDTAKRKEAVKTRSDYIKEARIAFNAYIRLRDASQLCICCAKQLGGAAIGGGYDCGHYRSVGSAPHLRFDERNAHAQRKQCNRYGAGRAVDYRIGLIARLGLSVVEALESDSTIRKFNIEELKYIKQKYRVMLKNLQKSQ